MLGMYKTSFNKVFAYIFCDFNQKIGASGNDCQPNLNSYLLDSFTGLTGKCSSINSIPRGDLRDKLVFICSISKGSMLLHLLLAILLPSIVVILICLSVTAYIYRRFKSRVPVEGHPFPNLAAPQVD